MELFKIAVAVASMDNTVNQEGVYTLITDLSKAPDKDPPFAVEREGLRILSDSMASKTGESELWDGSPSTHEIGLDVSFYHQKAEPENGIMTGYWEIDEFRVVSLDGKALGSEDAEFFESIIDLTGDEADSIITSKSEEDDFGLDRDEMYD